MLKAQSAHLSSETQQATASNGTAAVTAATTAAQQNLGGQDRESAMRKQFMMMIQKSMMQVLSNPNFMDMPMNPVDGMNPVNEINPVNPMDESSIPCQVQQSHVSNTSSVETNSSHHNHQGIIIGVDESLVQGRI